MSELTPFEKVQEFNRAFDVMPKNPSNYGNADTDAFKYARLDIFTIDPAAVKLRVSLITEEIKELKDAYDNNDLIEIRDALADILYVIYGMADVFGVNMDMIESEYYKKTIYNDMLKSNLENYIDSILLFESKLLLNVESRAFEESINTLMKIILEVYGIYNFIGVDNIIDFAIVHASNMSKLCSNEEEAIATVADYETKFKAGTSPYDTPYYYYIPEIKKWCVKNRSTGKVLKNINYIKVKFND